MSSPEEKPQIPRKFCKAFKHGTYGQILVMLGRGGDGQPVREIRVLTPNGIHAVQANVLHPDPHGAILNWVDTCSIADIEPTVKRIFDAISAVPEASRIIMASTIPPVRH